MLPKKKFREILFQLLFSYDASTGKVEDIVPFFMNYMKMTKKTIYEALGKVEKIFEKVEEVDSHIAKYLIDYQIEKITKVEKNILRLMIYEFLFDKIIDKKVAIAEAIRITKKYSSTESVKFVQAVLDAYLCSNTSLQKKTFSLQEA